jgi:hypothetical protein
MLSQSSYKELAANTRSKSILSKSGSPSGKRSERKGVAKGLPNLFFTGMLRALDAVPQGGANQTKKGF